MSFALQHKKRCLEKLARQEEAEQKQAAAKPAAQTPAERAKSKHDQAVIGTELERDLDRLSELESIEEKVALKRELLPKYLAHVEAYRESGARRPNPLLVYCLIWLLDVERIEEALALAHLAIEQQQLMPERFKRDLPTYVAETLHDWAERQYKASQSASPYLDEVVEAVHSEAWPVAQIIVHSKLYKLAGLFAERAGDIRAAITWYERAMAVNSKAGVKTRLKELQAKQ